MKTVFRYLTHPQVQIDPAVPVPKWGLSDVGRQRTRAMAGSAVWKNTKQIISSVETKAVETAQIIDGHVGVRVQSIEAMHENDRSSTGFLKPDAFEKMADAFFANPEISVKGWERAVDAQTRIVGEVQKILSTHKDGDILFVGHGAVGTLLYCHYADLSIDRKFDQPGGGGNFFTVEIEDSVVLNSWTPMENLR